MNASIAAPGALLDSSMNANQQRVSIARFAAKGRVCGKVYGQRSSTSLVHALGSPVQLTHRAAAKRIR